MNGFGFAALQTRIERFVVQVGGGPWTLLMQRSASFLPFIGLLRLEHPDPMNLALLVHLSQSYWDPIDPASYAGHIVDNPLPGRTVKKVIVQEALEDPLVNNVTTRYLVRTMEGKLPLLTPKQQSVYGVDEKAGPLDSAYAQWDTKSTWKHPGGNLTPKDAPPRDNSAHEILRRTESCTLQLERFFKPDGKVEHTCGSGPCGKQ